MTISVIIPCYNVSKHIEKVICKIPANINYIIIVNDCSTDETECILLQLLQGDKRLVYLKHEVNQGVGGAMLTGFKKALELNCDITIKMDGDDQMDHSNIHKLIGPIEKGFADFSKGNRFRDFKALKNMPAFRRFGNLGLSFLIKAASGYWNVFDPTNGFIAIHKETLGAINFSKIHKRYFFESSLLLELYYVNAVVVEVPMKAQYGDEKSHLSLSRTLFEFPPKLFYAFVRRIILKYFLLDFNIASFYILFGLPVFLFGALYGIIKYIKYASSDIPAPTGTVVIPTLLIILGFQLLLSAANYDVANYPKRNSVTL
jgi:glycosyltransferase involved in cell wall biosynthesis